MAKKKKSKAQAEPGGGDAVTSASVTSAAVPSTDAGAPLTVERAFQMGNFSEVRRLASIEASPEGKRLLDLVKVDRAQALVGLGALAFLVVVALVVLRL